MPVDAGTIYSEVRVQLAALDGDVRAVVANFDKIANQSLKTTQQVAQSWEKVQTSVGNIDKTYQGLKGTHDTLVQKQQALLAGIKDLISKGIDPENARVLALKKQYNDLETQTEETANATRASSEKTGESWNKLKIAAIAAFGVIMLAVKAFVKGSIDEYLKSEESSTRLAAALRSGGEYSAYAAAQSEKYAKTLQGVSKFEDEATQDALALLMSLGGLTRETAEETIPAVQDLASALGMGLSEAATLVSKAAEGNTGILNRYGITIKDTGDKSQNLAAITKALEERFGGLAAAMGDTASGKMVQLKNAFGDIKEEVGRATVDAIKPFVEWLTQVTKGIAGAIKASNDLREALRDQSRGLADTNDKLTIATAHYKDVNTQLHNFTDVTWLGTNAVLAMNVAHSAGFSSVDAYIEFLKKENAAARAAMTGVDALAKRELAAADARAKQAKGLQDYLDKVDAAYAKTAQGQADALKADIAYWENALSSATVTAPKVRAILGDLYASFKKWSDAQLEFSPKSTQMWDDDQRAMDAANKAMSEATGATNRYANSVQLAGEHWFKLALAAARAGEAGVKSVKDQEEELKYFGSLATSIFEGLKNVATADMADVGDTINTAIAAIAHATNTVEGEAVAAGLDMMTAFHQMVQAMNDTIFGTIEAERDRHLDVQQQILEQEISNVQTLLRAQLSAIDAAEQAALEAAGVQEATAAEQLQEKLAALEAEIAATADAEERKKLLVDRAELEKAIKRQEIQDDYQQKRDEAEEAANAKLRQYAHDRAILDQAIALAQAKIAEQKAIADLGWFNWDKKAQVEALYEQLFSAINAIPIPQMQTGGIVLPSSAPGAYHGAGRIVRVVENGAPELMLNGGAEGRDFLRAFAREVASEMRGGGGTIVVQSILDGKVIAESSARYFNKGITRLKR